MPGWSLSSGQHACCQAGPLTLLPLVLHRLLHVGQEVGVALSGLHGQAAHHKLHTKWQGWCTRLDGLGLGEWVGPHGVGWGALKVGERTARSTGGKLGAWHRALLPSNEPHASPACSPRHPTASPAQPRPLTRLTLSHPPSPAVSRNMGTLIAPAMCSLCRGVNGRGGCCSGRQHTRQWAFNHADSPKLNPVAACLALQHAAVANPKHSQSSAGWVFDKRSHSALAPPPHPSHPPRLEIRGQPDVQNDGSLLHKSQRLILLHLGKAGCNRWDWLADASGQYQ